MSEYERATLDMKQREFDQKQKGVVEQQEAAENTRQNTLTKIERLLSEETKGIENAYGFNNFHRRIPGSAGANTAAVIDEITGPVTLDALANMKGVPSDRNIDLVKGAATRLNNPNINNEEAKRAIREMYHNLGGDMSNLRGGASNNGTPKVGIVESGYKFVGGEPSEPANWRPVD